MYLVATVPTWAPIAAPHQHDDGRHQFRPALVGIGGGPVKTGDHDLKEVRPHRHVGGAADKVDQGRHADQTAADTQNSGQPAGQKADKNGQPGGTIDLGLFEMYHGRNLELMQGLVPFDAGGQLIHFLPAVNASCSFFFFLATSAKTIQAIRDRRTRYNIADIHFHLSRCVPAT